MYPKINNFASVEGETIISKCQAHLSTVYKSIEYDLFHILTKDVPECVLKRTSQTVSTQDPI